MKKWSSQTNNKIMLTVTCTICGADMECPESMISADRHFCAECTEMMADGYEFEGLAPVWKGRCLN